MTPPPPPNLETVNERIAVLEEQHKRLAAELEEVGDEVKTGFRDINTNLNEVNRTLSNQRSFWAGVTFVVSIVTYFAKEVLAKITAGGSS